MLSNGQITLNYAYLLNISTGPVATPQIQNVSNYRNCPRNGKPLGRYRYVSEPKKLISIRPAVLARE